MEKVSLKKSAWWSYQNLVWQ